MVVKYVFVSQNLGLLTATMQSFVTILHPDFVTTPQYVRSDSHSFLVYIDPTHIDDGFDFSFGET
jgi:hypothetical protein